MVFMFCPITAIFAIAALNDDCSFAWFAGDNPEPDALWTGGILNNEGLPFAGGARV
jgi:hypothetical protein